MQYIGIMVRYLVKLQYISVYSAWWMHVQRMCTHYIQWKVGQRSMYRWFHYWFWAKSI